MLLISKNVSLFLIGSVLSISALFLILSPIHAVEAAAITECDDYGTNNTSNFDVYIEEEDLSSLNKNETESHAYEKKEKKTDVA